MGGSGWGRARLLDERGERTLRVARESGTGFVVLPWGAGEASLSSEPLDELFW